MQPHNPYAAPAYNVPDPGQFGGQPNPNVSVMAALKFPMTSPKWMMNTLLGLVFLMIPFVGPLCLMGWQCEIMQRLAHKHPKPIPDLSFSDFVTYLTRGLVPFVSQLVVILPMMIVMYVMMAIMGIAVAVVAKEGGDAGQVGAFVGMGFGVLFVFLIAMFVSVLAQAMQIHAELTEDWGTVFSFGRIFRFGNKTWFKFILVSIVFGFFAFLLAIVGILALYIGVYFVASYLQIAVVSIRYQMYEYALYKGYEGIRPKALAPLASEAASGGPPQGSYGPPPQGPQGYGAPPGYPGSYGGHPPAPPYGR